MSQEAVEKLLGRLMTDDVFRKNAFHSIESVCREAGYDLNTSEMKAFNREDLQRIDQVAQLLDKSIKRYKHHNCHNKGSNGIED